MAAVASWRYVERPFRGKSGLFDGAGCSMSRVTLMAITIVASGAAIVAEGWPARSTHRSQDHRRRERPAFARLGMQQHKPAHSQRATLPDRQSAGCNADVPGLGRLACARHGRCDRRRIDAGEVCVCWRCRLAAPHSATPGLGPRCGARLQRLRRCRPRPCWAVRRRHGRRDCGSLGL